ncbi:MAG: T9SS type A sorting domain-containing protein [Chitinophagales bacterium]
MLHYVKYYWLLLIFIGHSLSAQNGWINTYTNAQYGLMSHENEDGTISIAGFKGIQSNNVLLLQINDSGEEMERFTFGDFNQDYTFQEENVQLLLTKDDGLLVSAYSDSDAPEQFVNLLKYTKAGELAWRKDYATVSDFEITALAEHPNGYVYSATDRDNERITSLTMTDPIGEVIWQEILSDSIDIEDIEVDTAGNIVLLGRKSIVLSAVESIDIYILGHYNAFGDLINANIIPLDYEDFKINLSDIFISEDNSLSAVGSYTRLDDPLTTVSLLLLSLEYNGSLEDVNGYQINGANYSKGNSVIKTNDNGWVVCGVEGEINNSQSKKGFYAKIDANGLLAWVSSDEAYNYGVSLNSVIPIANENYLFVGQNSSNFGGVKAIKTNKLGLIQTNTIIGNVFKDENDNCVYDEGELILKNAIVELRNLSTDEIQTQWSHDFGFDFRADTGRYLISVKYLDAVWANHCDSVIIDISEENSDIFINIPLFPKFDCPLMTVDLTTPIVERCEETNYKVQVINNGTSIAENAYLDVVLDNTIELLESSRPFSVIEDGWYRFQLGDVNFSAARVVDLLVRISCDSTILGQTHCASAYVYPDSLCINLNPEWDGSIIDVDGDCLGDSIGFEISNDGANRMRTPLVYYVIEDDAIFRTGNFQLDAGESIIFFIPSNGATYRVETDENPGFIFGGRPSTTIEGCGVESLEDASLGFVNRFPLYDNSPFVSIDCQENIIDLDGNLHLAYPEGYKEMNYIRVGDELEYFVRFENTSNAVVNRVEVIDTLDEFVDVSTLSIGVTSHPYSIQIEDNRILKIVFNDIDLSSNADGAHYGFIKFKVQLKENIAIGTRIENEVMIILDSSIILTETVFHTLGQELVLSVDQAYRNEITIKNYPNPFIEKSMIKLEGLAINKWTLQIYNTEGRLIRTDEHYGNEAWITRDNLSIGIYFFTIEDENGLIGSGKLVVQ